MQLPSYEKADLLVQKYNLQFGEDKLYLEDAFGGEIVYLYMRFWMKNDYEIEEEEIDFEATDLAKLNLNRNESYSMSSEM